jgi:hypothetical protein
MVVLRDWCQNAHLGVNRDILEGRALRHGSAVVEPPLGHPVAKAGEFLKQYQP